MKYEIRKFLKTCNRFKLILYSNNCVYAKIKDIKYKMSVVIE